MEQLQRDWSRSNIQASDTYLSALAAAVEGKLTFTTDQQQQQSGEVAAAAQGDPQTPGDSRPVSTR